MKKNIFDKLENKVPMPKGGKTNGTVMKQKNIEMTSPTESQKVSVKGTGKARKRTATWY
jgi:hypothetical protein